KPVFLVRPAGVSGAAQPPVLPLKGDVWRRFSRPVLPGTRQLRAEGVRTGRLRIGKSGLRAARDDVLR
ncbi:hypothetical protein, partial [Gluconobacter kondonii]|uniref:hypothetical protein n=1 Tax=Gluconobacter kondonii TaxID=941463 RepID=UPI0024E09AD0